MIWNRVPKHTHVGLNVMSVGVYDAISHFNDGEKATLDMLELLTVTLNQVCSLRDGVFKLTGDENAILVIKCR